MEPAHFEAAINGDVSKFPFCNIGREDLSEIFNKVTPSGDSLLHVTSSSGHEEMTQLIARNFPFLITKQNDEGNTALHLAVEAQKLNTVRAVIHISKQIPNTSTSTDTLLTMKNAEGNTALHEALFAILDASKKNVDTLVEMACYLVLNDPNVTCHQNNAGKSPLYMAVESGNKDILEYILNSLPQGDALLQRLQGKSPVHVAIEHTNLDMLITIKEKKEDLLLLQDEEGNTPLHFAALKGYKKGVRYLLEIKRNWAFERNTNGFYPLHLACENGHVKVMKVLFRKWPDPAALFCNKGQSILHVAAKNGKDNVVRCILSEKGTDKLVNKMDKNGNTPSHLAALHGHSMIVVTLMCDKRSKTDLVNYQGLTTYDIFKSYILKMQDHRYDVNDRNLKAAENVEENSAEVVLKSSEKFKRFQMMMTYSMLYIYYEHFRRRVRQIRRHHHNSTKISHIKIKPPAPKQDLNNTINYLFVVAALVVGAAFSGALQSPSDGGNGSNDASSTAPAPSISPKDEQNKDLLLMFLYNNYLTMNLSVTAAFSLFLALLLDRNLKSILVSVSFLLLELALISMGTAFFAAMMLRLLIIDDQGYLSDNDLQKLVQIVGIFQEIQLVLVVISVVAFTLGREALALTIYFILFCFYFPLHRIWSIIYFNSLKTFIKFVIYASFLLFVSTFVFFLLFF
ncbi:hypothetical protein Ddye_018584 [Dipteronia dyeriana]|uniref:PGG domain-containing protein n=1 Tax=Dipteronia dyeriana TaxID=168575 RepID=A0AAD9UBF2_9ROSI|nr:hypothetical protein Ddye_018584 [Dipteronia dyeriana]